MTCSFTIKTTDYYRFVQLLNWQIKVIQFVKENNLLADINYLAWGKTVSTAFHLEQTRNMNSEGRKYERNIFLLLSDKDILIRSVNIVWK